jgi:hypothetical protein
MHYSIADAGSSNITIPPILMPIESYGMSGVYLLDRRRRYKGEKEGQG